jgi:hypothetical protein
MKERQNWIGLILIEGVADQYESAEKITLAMDNLNTHKPG